MARTSGVIGSRSRVILWLVLGFSSGLTWAAEPKEPGSFLDHKAFARPELYLSTSHEALADLEQELPNQAAWRQFLERSASSLAPGPSVHAFIDPRSGAASNIIGAFPLLPGAGLGNRVTLDGLARRLGREVTAVDREVVAAAVLGFVSAHRAVLGIDVRQLEEVHASQVRADLWQFTIPQVYRGIPVRHARVAGTIVQGNLVVIGAEGWGDARVSPDPRIGAEEALEAGFAYAEGRTIQDEIVRQPRLEIAPVAPAEFQEGEAFRGPVGKGYDHRLVWTFVFRRPPEDAQWEVLVDAHDGEVIAFQDLNQYAQREIKGGVYPLTNTEICPDAPRCGVMQLGWPMPYADTGFPAPNNFTNSAGIYDYTSGTAATTLTGRYVDIFDNCGAIGEGSATGTIDMDGVNGQHDCTVPAGASPGNTASSRSCFYEINKIVELARGWLPANTWLQGVLTSNVNISQTCNAFYSFGGSINFYRSGPHPTTPGLFCRNTGEIAAVFDHEWGHALDDNDSGGALSISSEGYADIAAIYRLQASCVGYGFYSAGDLGCGQTADGTGPNQDENQFAGQFHCDLNCSGVRDADWDQHADHTPDTPLGFVCNNCLSSGGPCGRQVHCAAAPSRQAAWDLVARDLQAAPFSLDSQTAFIIGNKLFYQGSGNIGLWYACTCPSSSDGCGATNHYMQWLAADDDNGNLNDGTPHMTAIYNALNRHGVACATPTPQNSGCAGGPTAAPTLSATPGNFQVALSWSTVAGATRYWVFRTEGHAGCNFGKALIAEVTGTAYTDTAVANGRTYHYNVVAAGSSSACFGRASNCASATPTPADFTLSCSPSSLTIQQGGSGTSTCTLASVSGFNSAVSLSCANLPAGVTCTYNPNPVTPPPNGSVNSTLAVAVAAGTTPGTYTFQARGVSGSLTRDFNMTLQVTTPPPDFTIACNPPSLTIPQGSSGTSTCTITSLNSFSSAVSLSCVSLPIGATCTFNPNPVTPPPNGSASSVLVIAVSPSTTSLTYPIQVRGVSGSLIRSFGVTLVVTPNGGPQTAVFDAALRAPKCGAVGASCDSGPSLLNSRNSLATPEPNQPNTIQGSCADGTFGAYHSDESNDRIKVSTLDGTNLAPGKTVRIDATVWAWAGFTADKLDLYYAADAHSPVWTFITTLTPTVPGAQTFSATYTLPGGSVQAVRARFRYVGSATPCSGTSFFDDHDDLVFAVQAAHDATLKAPKCGTASSVCDSGAGVDGRDGKGPEPNQPNTINNSCADGTLGGYHSDESNDRIRVSTLDGKRFAPEKTVRIDATAWAYFFAPTSDHLDLFYAADATNPTWTLLTTLTPSAGGTQSFSATYTLPAGSLQAVRANFRFAGGASPCTTGVFDDRDDLIFAVEGVAAYDPTLKAPKCASVGSICDSGTLLDSRDSLATPEPNQPNTINNSCADGTFSAYHSDESNDRIKVFTLDGSDFAPGKTVQIDADVWAWAGSPTSDQLDLYYAANAGSPTWTYITTLTPTVAGAQTLSATYTLPAGSLQAIRARFRYAGSATPCSTSFFDDHDDLIFAVQ